MSIEVLEALLGRLVDIQERQLDIFAAQSSPQTTARLREIDATKAACVAAADEARKAKAVAETALARLAEAQAAHDARERLLNGRENKIETDEAVAEWRKRCEAVRAAQADGERRSQAAAATLTIENGGITGRARPGSHDPNYPPPKVIDSDPIFRVPS